MIELAHKKNNAFIGMKSTYSIEFNVKVECFLPLKNITLYYITTLRDGFVLGPITITVPGLIKFNCSTRTTEMGVDHAITFGVLTIQ